jgi:hypothetical protein
MSRNILTAAAATALCLFPASVPLAYGMIPSDHEGITAHVSSRYNGRVATVSSTSVSSSLEASMLAGLRFHAAAQIRDERNLGITEARADGSPATNPFAAQVQKNSF